MVNEDLSSSYLSNDIAGDTAFPIKLISCTHRNSNGQNSTSCQSIEWFKREISDKKHQTLEAEKLLARVEHEYSRLLMLMS